MTNSERRDQALANIRNVADGILKDGTYRDEIGVALHAAADVLEEESETCKFNCRNKRATWVSGYVTAYDEMCGYGLGYHEKQDLIEDGQKLYHTNKEFISGYDKEAGQGNEEDTGRVVDGEDSSDSG